jgi:hypothetical protein
MYYLHYTNNIFITIALILSFILLVYNWTQWTGILLACLSVVLIMK